MRDAPERKQGLTVGMVIVALILLFGAVSVALTFDSLVRGLILLAEIALPVALLASLVLVRRKNRRRMEDLDD